MEERLDSHTDDVDGTYTLAISAFEPGQTGKFDLSIDCAAPIRLEAIPQEGAGMYRRTCEGEWYVSPTPPLPL